MSTAGHTTVPFPAPRRLVAASSTVGRMSNTIHTLTEVDVEKPRRWFIRFATRNTALAKRYGVITVTAVGMVGLGAAWAIPLTAATVTLTVGGIVRRPVLRDGDLENREHLCLTVSFNHDVVDGAPAARFLKRFSEILSAGEVVREAAD